MTDGTTEAPATGSESQTPSSGTEGGGAPAPLFWESFQDEGLKADAGILRYKSAEELARGYKALENRLGVPADQLIKLPTKDDDKEGWAAVYDKLGRPKTADEYGLKVPEDAPDDVKATAGELASVFHEMGLNTTAAQRLVTLLADKAKANVEAEAAASAQAAADCKKTLQTEFGAKFDTYVREIPKVVSDAVGPEGLQALNDAGFGNNVTLMKLLAKVADWRAEPGTAPGAGGATEDRGMTPAAARAARIVLESDPVKGAALTDRNNPRHADVIEERNRLLALESARAA